MDNRCSIRDSKSTARESKADSEAKVDKVSEMWATEDLREAMLLLIVVNGKSDISVSSCSI